MEVIFFHTTTERKKEKEKEKREGGGDANFEKKYFPYFIIWLKYHFKD